jgi:hypothetical protein
MTKRMKSTVADAGGLTRSAGARSTRVSAVHFSIHVFSHAWKLAAIWA